jgi:hypothetical protein
MSGWGGSQPTGLVRSASASIGSSATTTLIAPTANGIRLISLALSAGVCAPSNGAGQGFLVEDVVNDTNGVQYLAVEIGLPVGVVVNGFNSVSLDEAGIVVPAGATVQLVNGGAAGTTSLRRCSASATYVTL